MFIHLSSLSSFLNDGCEKWFEERGIRVSLLGSLANDKGSIGGVLDGTVKCCRNFMWDCGAISVRNKKTKITLEDYVQSVREIPPSVVPITVVGLDVIGDPIASQKNYLRLKYDYGFGNGFLPTFHYGEDMDYLETIVEEGFEYIGLGGVGAGDRLAQDPLRDWVRNVMFVNGDNRTLRYPHVKWHGFAQTSKVTMAMFPYYSVDSAAWVKNSMLGKILTPYGDWRASDDPRTGVDPQHIERAGQKTLDKICEWISTFGFTLEQVTKGRFEKHIVNINYFLELEKNHNWKPSNIEQKNIYSLAQELGVVPVKQEVKRIDLGLLSMKKELELKGIDIMTVIKERKQEEFIIKEVEPTMSEKKVSSPSPLSNLKALQIDLTTIPVLTKKIEDFKPAALRGGDAVVSDKIELTLLQPPQPAQKPLIPFSQSEKISEPQQHEQGGFVQGKMVSSVLSVITCPHCSKFMLLDITTKISERS